MRYRANTRLKGAPKHLASPVIHPSAIEQEARYLWMRSQLNMHLPWHELPESTRRALSAEAEQSLHRAAMLKQELVNDLAS